VDVNDCDVGDSVLYIMAMIGVMSLATIMSLINVMSMMARPTYCDICEVRLNLMAVMFVILTTMIHIVSMIS
jgi:hypothetical protein